MNIGVNPFAQLPMELIHQIARVNGRAWFLMTRAYPLFRQYAWSPTGRDEFIELFTVSRGYREKDQRYSTADWTLFGKLHRTPDKNGRDRPAKSTIRQPRKINPALHIAYNADPLPKIDGIESGCNITLYYFINGQLSRPHGLPTIVGFNTHDQVILEMWRNNTKFYRENNLPVRVTYYHGVESRGHIRSEWWNDKYAHTRETKDTIEKHWDKRGNLTKQLYVDPETGEFY